MEVLRLFREQGTGLDAVSTPEIELGLRAFHNAGDYGASMASNYNSKPRPAEVLLQEGEARLIRHRETLDDLLGTQPGA